MVVKELLSIGSVDVLGRGMTAIFWFYLATVIEPEEYGEIFFFIGIGSIASYLALFGTENVITVYVSKNVKIQSTLFFISIIAGIISSLIVMIIFYRFDMPFLIFGYIINILAIGELLGKKLYHKYSLSILIQKGLTLVLGVGFFYLFGTDGILYALGLSYAYFSIRIYKVFKETKIDFSLLKPRMSFIINNYIVYNTGGFTGQIDKLIIAPMLGFVLLGNFSLALQLVSVLLILPNVIFRYIIPQDARGERNRKLKIYSIILAIVLAAIGIIISPILIPIIFPKYIDVVDAVQIMCLCVIPATISSIYWSKFLAYEKSKFLIYAQVSSLVTMLVGFLILGPILGLVGLAIIFVISYVASLLTYVVSNYFLNEELNSL